MPEARRAALWSPEALDDRERISGTALESPVKIPAEKIPGNRRATTLIEEHPFAGRARNELRPGLRSFAATPHVVFYRVVDDAPQIVRVLDGRQDIEEKFAVRDLA